MFQWQICLFLARQPLVGSYSYTRFLDHTQRRATVGRTHLDEWSARRRDLYLTTHNTHNRQTSMPPGGIRTHNGTGNDRSVTYRNVTFVTVYNIRSKIQPSTSIPFATRVQKARLLYVWVDLHVSLRGQQHPMCQRRIRLVYPPFCCKLGLLIRPHGQKSKGVRSGDEQHATFIRELRSAMWLTVGFSNIYYKP